MNEIKMEIIHGIIYVDLFKIKEKLLESPPVEFSTCYVPYKEAERYVKAHGDARFVKDWNKEMRRRMVEKLRGMIDSDE